MKKFLSGLFFILLCCGAGVFLFFNPGFLGRQVDKVTGMYYVYKGDKAYKKLKLQKAIDYYNQGLRLYPEHYEAWYNLGNIYVVYEDYYSAVDAYENSIQYNPKFIMARMNYGIISAEKLGDFDGAISQYQEIINTKRHLLSIPFVYSNRKSYKINKGLAYYNMGLAYRQKSIYLNDDFENQSVYLQDAIEAYKKAIKYLKKDYDTRYNLALAYHLLGDTRQAGLNYCKAIEISPMNYEAHYNLAILLRRMKYYKEALSELEKATTLISSSDGISTRQMYVFDVMNEVTRTLLANPDKTYFLETISDDKKAAEEEENSSMTYINGKLVSQEELDKAILKNFKTCSSKSIFLDKD